MYDFLKFIDDLRHSFPVHVEIYYSRVMDWCIKVYKQGCAKHYPGTPCDGEDALLCNVQSCDMELAFAQAHAAVKNWMLEYNGGY